MPFEKHVPRTAVAIGRIRMIFDDPGTVDNILNEPPTAQYEINVHFNDGSLKTVTGNLLPEMTPAQKTGATNLANAIRAEAVAKILP